MSGWAWLSTPGLVCLVLASSATATAASPASAPVAVASPATATNGGHLCSGLVLWGEGWKCLIGVSRHGCDIELSGGLEDLVSCLKDCLVGVFSERQVAYVSPNVDWQLI